MVRRPRHLLAKGFVAVVLLYLYLPVVITVLFSFATSPRLSLPIKGLTFDWYISALANPLITVALQNSLILAAVSIFALVGFGALSVDVGYLFAAQRALQASADAAAIAGARDIGVGGTPVITATS